MNSFKWHQRFLDLAVLIAGWSKDPSTQVGAVATRDRRILATGYNGLPMGVRDTDERLLQRDLKYQMIAHAEANCITHAANAGVSLAGATIYVWPFHPCSSCAGLLINGGIRRVVIEEAEIPERWKSNFELAKLMFDEAGVELLEVQR